MFADTLTVTINSVAKVLVRVNQDGYSSEYRLVEPTSEFRLRLRNTQYPDKARQRTVYRHNVELIETVYPVAPAVYPTIRKTYTVLENDQGDAVASAAKFATGLLAFQTEANTLKLLNFES